MSGISETQADLISEATVHKLAQKWQDLFDLGAWDIEVVCVPKATVGGSDEDEQWGSAEWGTGCVETANENQWARITVATKQPLQIVDETLCHEHAHLAIGSAVSAAVEKAINIVTTALMKAQE